MRTVQFSFFILLSYLALGQQNPFAKMQVLDKEKISTNNIKSITGYEYDFSVIDSLPDSLLPQGMIQTKEIYDERGRLVEKENYWNYSDLGSLKRTLAYDDRNDNIIEYNQYRKDQLERSEYFLYDDARQMTHWKVDFSDAKQLDYSKAYIYDSVGSPIYTQIMLGRKVLRSDSIVNRYDTLGRKVLELVYKEGEGLKDSVAYRYDTGDTSWVERIYYDGELHFVNALIKIGTFEFYRHETYSSGIFMGVNYRIFVDGSMVKDKVIHHYPELNYTKTFHYDGQGVLQEKKIYRNTRDPKYVVKYALDYYGKKRNNKDEDH